MLKFLITIGLPALCLLCGSCVYSPDNEPFTEVPTVFPTEAIALGGFSPEDTIQLYSKKKFTVTSPVSGRKNYELEVYINSQIVKRIDATTPTFTFEINPTELPNGLLQMRVVILYASASGSLADKLDNEYLQTTQTWKVLVDNVPPNAVTNTKVDISDGRLRIRWDKPSKTNFSHYHIIRLYTSAKPIVRDTFKIEDNRLTTYFDESYVGGPVSYQVDFKGAGFTSTGSPTISDCVPVPIVLEEGYPNPKFKFGRSLLYNNKIVVNWYADGHSAGSYSPSAEGAVFVNSRNLGFGEVIPYTISVSPVAPRPFEYMYQIKMSGYLGFKTKPFTLPYVYYAAATKKYYFANSVTSPALTTIYSMDAVTMKITDSLVVQGAYNQFITSPNTLQSYLINTNGDRLKRINLSTLDVEKDIDLGSSPGFSTGPGYNTGVTNDNLLYGHMQNGTTAKAIDLNTNVVAYTATAGDDYPYLSADGQHLALDGYFYKRTGSSFVFYASVKSFNYASFTADGKLMTWTFDYAGAGTTVRIYDVSATRDNNRNLPVMTTLTNSKYGQSIYDPHTNTYFNGTTFFDTSLNEKSTVPFSLYYGTTFVNGILFNINGFYLPQP